MLMRDYRKWSLNFLTISLQELQEATRTLLLSGRTKLTRLYRLRPHNKSKGSAAQASTMNQPLM